MRRLYVMPLSVYREHMGQMHRGSAWHGLFDQTVPGAEDAWHAAGEPVLVNAEFHGEYWEDLLHSHPEVAILPNPTTEPTDTIKKHIGSPAKKLKKKHVDQLAALGVVETDTVYDVSAKVARINPNLKLRMIV